MGTYQSIVTAPQSVNASVDTIRGYYNAYLMHKIYVEYLVNLGAKGLLIKGWAPLSTSVQLHNDLSKLLDVLKYNVKKLAQLVSCI